MRDFIYDHFTAFLCAAVLVSRLGDVLSTYFATPNLKLEANPIVRKLGWRFAVLTLLAALVPLWSTEAGIGILVASLFVWSSNCAKIWLMRALGEDEYRAMLVRAARRSKLSHALLGVYAAAFFIAFAGAVLCFFYPDPEIDSGFWFGFSIVAYAVVVALYGTLWFRRIFRSARAMDTEAGAALTT
ncbi:MAG: hypothetical protein HYR85_17010 [Planctomycetes bacterium]|nr:hypothetical protein [Planctomycetota bacterium]MBI3845340.1 hypothetical protein [Planctomycetota bacterium]